MNRRSTSADARLDRIEKTLAETRDVYQRALDLTRQAARAETGRRTPAAPIRIEAYRRAS